METDIKENRGTERTDKTKSWFSEKINTIEKLARLVKKKGGGGGRRRKQITNIRKNRCKSLQILHIFFK